MLVCDNCKDSKEVDTIHLGVHNETTEDIECDPSDVDLCARCKTVFVKQLMTLMQGWAEGHYQGSVGHEN